MQLTRKTGNLRRPVRLVVAIEHHFVRVGGSVYTSLAFGYEYWKEYLEVFDEVHVLARVGRAEEVPAGHFVADGPGVGFIPVPDYLGPRQFLRRLPGVMRAAARAARLGDRFILRSGNVCTALWICLKLAGTPYSREVQGDIGEAIRHFTRQRGHRALGELIACLSDAVTRCQLRGAYCASYVSEFCRRLYPSGKPQREYVFSSVRLDEDVIASPRPAESFDHAPLRLLSVGRLEKEKGHHVLVEAARVLRDRGVSGWHLKIVGPGRELQPLRRRVEEYALGEQVEVAGPVRYGPELFALLDEADVFVLPSLTEGMPRSLIEAMARGLPAVASRTGGIIELLSPRQLVPPGRADALAEAIRQRIGNPVLLAEESRLNFHTAVTRYGAERMRRLKHAYWQAVLAGPPRPLPAARCET